MQIGCDGGELYGQLRELALDELLAKDFVHAPALDEPAAQAEIHELEHALPVQSERPSLQLIEPARGERRPDKRTDRAARDEIGLHARFHERPQDADMRPAARRTRSEHESDFGPARHHCTRAHKSWASERNTFTRAKSPGESFLPSSICTTPSISGASPVERATAPSGPPPSTSTCITFPTLRLRRPVLIFSCSCMSRARRSSRTSPGSAPDSSFAFAPSTGEYAKQPTRSSSASSRKPSSSRNSLSVSPGKPAMKVLRMVISGQILRQARIRSRLSSPLAGRFISFRMRRLACWKGTSM